MLPKLKKHIFVWSSIIVLMAGAAFANLTSHTEPLIDALLLVLDSTHNGAISDEAWYSAFITSTEIGAAYDTEAEFNNLFSGKQDSDADLTTWAGITPGANVGTALAIAIGTAGAPIVFDGALGTPTSGALTNCSGYPETGDVSGVLDDTGGAVPVLLQASTEFSADDATPSVTGHSLFRTANANPTTITDFDNPTDGQNIWVLVNDAVTTFSFSTGIEGYSTSFLADNGAVYHFYYDATDTNWHMEGVPSTISISAIYDTVPIVDADAVTKKIQFDASPITAANTRTITVLDVNMGMVASTSVNASGVIVAAGAATVMKTEGATISLGDWSAEVADGAYYSKAFRVPFKATLTKIILTSDGNVGSCTIDVWSDAASATTGMDNITDADSLFDTATEPAIADASADNYFEVTSFDDGESAIAAGDWVVVNVDACTTLTGLNISFEMTRTD